MSYIIKTDTEIGRIIIAEDGKGISEVLFETEKPPENAEEKATPLLLKAKEQLEEYFAGVRMVFELPLSLKGTKFQLEVWEALGTIPYGETRSYKQIAEQIGRPGACQAVGQANHVNRIPILVPCHRVIGANGKLVGYGGGMEIKEKLLELEKNGKKSNRNSSIMAAV